MKKLFFTLGILLAMGIQVFAATMDDALLRAKSENKPLVVMVTTSGCVYCIREKKQVLPHAKVQEALVGKIFIEVDSSKESLPKSIETRFAPSFFYLSESGEVLGERYGFQDVDQLASFLKNP
ncbi:MAG: thioredoxin family protein [Wolinella sp.]